MSPLQSAQGRTVLGINHDVIDVAGGGQRVVVEVSSSAGCTGITIGGVACSDFMIDDATHVSGVPSAHASGVVDVVVMSDDGPSTRGIGLVEYWSPPAVAPCSMRRARAARRRPRKSAT